jgi:UDP-N-acetyl-D-glucosamine dehydrogenase
MNIAVIGLGKIGLPLAVQFAMKGNLVVGLDINPETIELVKQGKEPFFGEADLSERLALVSSKGLLQATDQPKVAIEGADVVVVAIPLIVNGLGAPDFLGIDEVSKQIGLHIKVGALVVFETTLPIGSTRKRIAPIIEKYSKRKVGNDFFLVFSPERVLTGRIFSDLRRYPKIVGGVTNKCTETGAKFYSKVLDFDLKRNLTKENGVWAVRNSDTAEFIKLAETTYRDVNIGLANQFSLLAKKEGLDIFEIIESANSQDYSHIHAPGISVGGHCIPIYPQFYLQSDPEATIVKAAREINESMPIRAVASIKKAQGNLIGTNVLILGITYREKVPESAFSGSIALKSLLENEGAKVFGDDPILTTEHLASLGFNTSFEKSQIDVIILHTAHEDYTNIDLHEYVNLVVFYDGRRKFKTNLLHEKVKYLTF